MDIDADMMGDQADDALAIRVGNAMIGFAKAFGKTIYPQSSIRIEHNLDNLRVVKVLGDDRTQRCAQHARTA